jgi:hypothetical protein
VMLVQWQRVLCHALSDGSVWRAWGRVAGSSYSVAGQSPMHVRQRYVSMLLTASHATCSHVQWYHCLHESHCTQRSPDVSTAPQHCNTGRLMTVGREVGVSFCRLVPRCLRSAREGGGMEGADEADEDAATDDEDDEAEEEEEAGADAGDAADAVRPYCSMTVSNLAFNSSSDN